MKKTRFNVTIEPIAECSVMIKIDLELETRSVTDLQHPYPEQRPFDISVLVAAIAQKIQKAFAPYLMNVTPAYQTILVDYLPYRIQEPEFIRQLNHIIIDIDATAIADHSTSHIVTIPTYYSENTALDLARFEQHGLSLDKIIDLHTSLVYQVSAVGFMPGFAFLSDVSPELHMPRHETPRLSVPKGSVAIADSKTAVYPDQSPGGWNIIGRSPLTLFDRTVAVDHLTEASLFNVGDRVKFEAIDKETFIDLGGCLNE